MKEYKMEDPDKILKKVTNSPIMAKVAMLVSIIFLGFAIFGIIEIFTDSSAIVFIILGGILSITFFLIYYFQSKRVRYFLKTVDLDKVRKEIKEGVLSSNLRKTYFTKSYMLSNFYYGFILEYKDILWVYKRTLYDTYTALPRFDLVVCAKNGKKYYTDYDDRFVEEIVFHNKDVLVGNDKENKQKYKEMVNENKR